ncbi:beta-galactosidase [Polaribacter reichenbachii]|uniref:beta-galactosidase n=1 Tax=Polaribacter reichenbachii TaxID=996801 RepID=A0A1B8TV35_9FLAO|nr:glycoside hydrolase family 2 TIM barrel-domain containing protein [Polaribacter reichenbachii]APZ45569.1 beta-galactosidase [Polaribacter reichenbachii]AUC19431.1 beta-galactosidase [Polaribacter reichenbachii]OBY63414.1 beta-galactosidase [Polaribacter reichenbachii]
MKNQAIIRLLFLIQIVFWVGNIYAQKETKTIKKYLTGTDKDNTLEWDFFCSDGMKSGKWDKIAVPSCWELQGFGNYNYGRDYKDKKSYFKEYGLYKYNFSVSEDWKNKNVKIVFEGVMTDAEVKINGKLAGEIHQGAFYEFKYDVSKLLKYGKDNLIEVKVNKESSNESINHAERRADFWIFGGIYRPVYLEASPKNNIERVAIDAKANGNIVADIFTKSKKATAVKLVLKEDLGKKVQDVSIKNLNKEDDKLSISAQALNIKTWNPEKPNMYQLQIYLLDKKGNTLHQTTKKIGFRTIEIRESDGIYVNNQKIKFKGVNRHSFYPNSGRTTSKALSIEHIKMMKDMNMNAVRMSHYPPDKHFLEACDSIGLFVIDEVCTWHVPYLDTKVGKKIIKETIVRDVNHPSIILWANGNESGWNNKLDNEYHKHDIQKREVIHPWAIFGKMNTMHYPEYHIFAYDSPRKDKIYFPTEFMHGLYDGGHGASLDSYWKQIWNMPLAAGGFLWDFADESVIRTDKGGILDSDGNHAADGIVGPYGEKEASYFTVKEIWSPIYIAERFIRDDFSGIFDVENRYHFTNLNECKITAQWVNFNGPKKAKDIKVMSESNVNLPDLAPGLKGTFTINKPKNWQSADALYLTATDATGNTIFTWSYLVKNPKNINNNFISDDKIGIIKSTISGDKILINANGNRFVFSKKTGLLKEVKKGDKIIPLKDGPILLGSKSKLEMVNVIDSEDKVEIIALFEKRRKYWDWKENKETTQDFLKWTIKPNGTLDLHVEIRNIKMVKEYMGITFSFPEKEVRGMKWLGDGPYRVWRNRMKGTQFKVWENDYNNTVTGETEFVYPEFKGFFSSLNWLNVKGNHNNGFTVYCNSKDTYLRMLTPDQPEDPEKGASVKNFPKGDISFVKNIPAIGTKFKEPNKMGPYGNEIHYFGNDDEPIVLDLTFEF